MMLPAYSSERGQAFTDDALVLEGASHRLNGLGNHGWVPVFHNPERPAVVDLVLEMLDDSFKTLEVIIS